MNIPAPSPLRLLSISLSVLLLSQPAAAAENSTSSSALLDDFNHAVRTTSGIDRIIVTDSTTGGNSQLRPKHADGVLSVEGEVVPARGQPGWASLVLVIAPAGAPVDLSRYEGIRIKVRVKKGTISIAANSADITNFDYHSFLLPRKSGGIQELRIPFSDMKRSWSEQIPLNRATVTSVSLVAFDLQKSDFAYDVDEIGFY